MNSEKNHQASCEEVLSELYLFLDAECDSAGSARIKQHLTYCPGCFQEYGIEQEVKALVARCWSAEEAPAGLKERLREKLRQAVEPETDAASRIATS